MIEIFEGLLTNKTIRTLNISSNRVGDGFVKEIYT